MENWSKKHELTSSNQPYMVWRK